MARKTFTVTVDGVQIGKRQSATRTYTHALLLAAEAPAEVIAQEEAYLASLAARVDALNAALADPKVTIRPRNLSNRDFDYQGRPSFNGYTIHLAGTAGDVTVEWHANAKGEVKGGYPLLEDGSFDHSSYDRDMVMSAREFLVARAKGLVNVHLDYIKKTQAKVDALKAGDLSSLAGPSIVSWHTSGPLALKASGAGWLKGRRVTVVPVDAN